MGDRSPRAALLHPVAVAAIAVLLVNDHVLKSAWPGWWTGKLSDVAGLIVAPLAVAAVCRAVARREAAHGGVLRGLPVEALIAIAVGVAFSAVKLDPSANRAYAVVLGVVSWPLGAIGDVLATRPIQPLGSAPTALDGGDLIALPAILVGWWLASGASSRRGPIRAELPIRFATAARMTALGAAWFALAATSYAGPTSRTEIAPDVETVFPDGAPIVQRATVTIGPGSPRGGSQDAIAPSSVRVQARPRWPFNDPPVRFSMTIDGVGVAAGPGPVLEVPPSRCGAGCTLSASVAIEWPGGTAPGGSSVAWELVATADTPQSAAPPRTVAIDAPGFHRIPSGNAVAILILGLFAVVAYGVAAGPVRRAFARRSPTRRSRRILLTLVGAIPTLSLAGVLVGAGFVVTFTQVGSPLGRSESAIGAVAVVLAATLLVGLVRWLRGSGTVLTIGVVATAMLGLPTAVVLISAATPSFAQRGFELGLVFVNLIVVVTLLAAARRSADGAFGSEARVLFVAVEVALMGLLVIATPGDLVGIGLLSVGALAFGLWAWWEGSGWVLGLASVAIAAAGVTASFIGGPGLLLVTSQWTATDRLVHLGLVAGGLTGLVAALGQIASPPKDEPWQPTYAVQAALARLDVDDSQGEAGWRPGAEGMDGSTRRPDLTRRDPPG